MKAGFSKKDITPSVGTRLAGHTRYSTGVHDPLFAKALVIDDGENSVAFVYLDLVRADFAFCDWIRTNISNRTGIKNVLVNISHTHSSPPAAMRELEEKYDPIEKKWLEKTKRMILNVVEEAYLELDPVSLHVGRAPVQVGFNRRLADANGFVQMKINKDGPVVPWVNVLKVCDEDDYTIVVLFEHACHPVIVHSSSSLTSADFPGFAVKRIEENLKEGAIAIFAQGCGGNINGYPLQGGFCKAEEAGTKLGDAVLKAMHESRKINVDKVNVKSKRIFLPIQEIPSWWLRKENIENSKFQSMIDMINRGKLANLRFEINAVMLGSEWCLVALSHDIICEYELWIDDAAPFHSTMVLGYTNGNESYVATDNELKLGEKGGYEAGSLLAWGVKAKLGGQVHPPLVIGSEGMIKENIKNLWTT
jgi:hypothetical protein